MQSHTVHIALTRVVLANHGTNRIAPSQSALPRKYLSPLHSDIFGIPRYMEVGSVACLVLSLLMPKRADLRERSLYVISL